MRVPEEPVCIYLFRQSPVFTSLHLISPVDVVPPLIYTVYGVNYSIHGIRSHDSDLALYVLRNQETTGSLGEGKEYRYCLAWVSPGLKGLESRYYMFI